MWWTPDGERILQGAEAQLFREALAVLVDMVRDDDEGMWQFPPRPSTPSSPTRNWPSLPKSAAPCSGRPTHAQAVGRPGGGGGGCL